MRNLSPEIMRISKTLAILVALAVSGCSGPKLIGRYSRASCIDETRSPSVEVSCTAVLPTVAVSAILAPAAPASRDRGGLAMPERALAAYVTALSDRRISASARDLRTNITSPLTAEAERSRFDDQSLVSGTLTVTVAHAGSVNPADGIEWARISVQQQNAQFQTWTAARTATSEFEAGQYHRLARLGP